MHRKWIRDWRKTVDSAVWTMPPLHYKVWKWILYRADYKTGTLQTSMNQIADGVQWEEYGVVRIPNRKTIMTILERLEAEKMITRESNRLYTTLTIVNWGTYNTNDDEKVTENGQPNGQPFGHSSRSTHEKYKEEDSHELYPVVVPAREDEPTGGDGVGMITEEEKQNLKLRFGIPDPAPEPEPEDEPPSPFDTPPDTPPQACYDLIRQFGATLGIPLTPRPYEAAQLEAERRKGRLTDDQMRTAVIEGASWISENCRMRPWPGILGIIRKFDPHKKPGAKRFIPEPVHNPAIEQDKKNRCPKCKKRNFVCDCGYIRH